MKVIKRIKPLGWIAVFIIVILVNIAFNQMSNKSEAGETVIVNSENWNKYPGIDLHTEAKEYK